MAFWKQLTDVRRDEVGTVLGLSAYFFVTIACYWFLKPLRSALTVGFLGADSIAELKVITALVSAGVVVAYAIAVKRLGRKRLAGLVLGSFFWLFLLASLLLLMEHPPKEAFYAFYIAVDLFITVNVALFWGLVSDVVDHESAGRLYGWIGVGGVLGGLVGSLTCHRLVALISPASMTASVAVVNLALIPLALGILGRHQRLSGLRTVLPESNVSRDDVVGAREPIGVRNLGRYVAAIGVMVAGYEFASAISDFTFHKSVELFFSSRGELPSLGSLLGAITPEAMQGTLVRVTNLLGIEMGHTSLGAFFAEFFLVLNLLAVALQLVATPWVLRRWGASVGILILPAVFLLTGVGFMALPSLGLAAWMFASDNSLNYSMNQTSRQMLFVPIPSEGKYRALAVTDILVQRSAKALAGFALLGFSALKLAGQFSSLRWAMALLLPLVIVWFIAAHVAGKAFRSFGPAQRQDEDTRR